MAKQGKLRPGFRPDQGQKHLLVVTGGILSTRTSTITTLEEWVTTHLLHHLLDRLAVSTKRAPWV